MTTTALALPTIEELKTKIHGLSVQRGLHEGKFTRLSERLIELDAHARDLKIKLARGDQNASIALDTVESERKKVAREIDGLRVLIDGFGAEIEPLQDEMNVLVQAREKKAAEEADRNALNEWNEDLRAISDRFYSQYLEITRTLGEIRIIGHAGIDRFGVVAQTAFEKMVTTRFRAPITDLRNAGWRDPQGTVYQKDFEVQGLVPPGQPRVRVLRARQKA